MQLSLIILLCRRSDTRHYGHVNRCFYLLTYLLDLLTALLVLTLMLQWYFRIRA